MALLTNMPVELVLEIIHLLLNEDLTLPVVGQNAAMIPPPISQICWNIKPSLKNRIVQGIPWLSSKYGLQEKQRAHEVVLTRRPHCDLKALRAYVRWFSGTKYMKFIWFSSLFCRTNRYFDAICQPFLYRELNLLSDLRLKQWKRAKNILPLPRWSLIRSVAVYMDPNPYYINLKDAHLLDPFIDQSTTVAYILEKCRNLTSVALYYRHASVRTMRISSALLSLLNGGRLTALGVYSCRLLQSRTRYARETEEAEGVIDLLESIALHGPAQRSLRVLEVVADWIPVHVFDLIRANFPSLETLTLRRVVREPWFQSRMWDADQRPKWHLYPNLTRLHLDDFEPGDASQFPSLVRHFPALVELKVTACGKDLGVVTKWRAPGWSQRPSALCNGHRPLKTLYVAHMEAWEVYELGVIPAINVIITTIKHQLLLELFVRDDEIFPGIQCLSLAPLSGLATAGDDASDGDPSIEAICGSRGISLGYNAEMMRWTCRCAFHEAPA